MKSICHNKQSTTLISALLLVFTAGIGGAFAQNCVAPPGGLVAWWKGDGNADSIQGTHNGTLTNGADFALGKVGQADSPSALQSLTAWFIRIKVH